MRQGPESESPAHERLRLRLHTPDYIMSGIAEKVFKVIGQRSKVKGQTIPIKAEAYILTAWRRSSIVFYCIDLKRLHSSTKKVMFHTGFVCLSVCLSVCLLATLRKTISLNFMKILQEIYLWTRKKSLNFGSDDSGLRIRNEFTLADDCALKVRSFRNWHVLYSCLGRLIIVGTF